MSFANDFKHWFRDLFRYPAYRPADSSYDEYWAHRDMNGGLNAFQEDRTRMLLGMLSDGDSVLDVGCGDGKMLAFLKKEMGGLGELAGVDSSEAALARAHERGVNAIRGDIGDPGALPDVGMYDWVTLLEVIEHVPHSERLLEWARSHARKGVIFSVPNTGFIVHRLRLLFGRFPLQWRAHPAEHVRFWTLRDMKWWLRELPIPSFRILPYQGIPVLNRLWPSLFAAGLFVELE